MLKSECSVIGTSVIIVYAHLQNPGIRDIFSPSDSQTQSGPEKKTKISTLSLKIMGDFTHSFYE